MNSFALNIRMKFLLYLPSLVDVALNHNLASFALVVDMTIIWDFFDVF